MRKQVIIERLRAHRTELEAMGVMHLALFGAVARDMQEPGSDINNAAEFNGPAQVVGLFEFVDIRARLSDLLEGVVDLAPREALRPHVRVQLKQDQILVF